MHAKCCKEVQGQGQGAQQQARVHTQVAAVRLETKVDLQPVWKTCMLLLHVTTTNPPCLHNTPCQLVQGCIELSLVFSYFAAGACDGPPSQRPAEVLEEA